MIRRSRIRRRDKPKKRKPPGLVAFKRKLWPKFAAFIKRTKGNTCFSCGKKDLVGKDLHAGHMFSAGMYPALRWLIECVWPQCSRCNIFLKGNYIEYHARYIAEFGQEAFNKLYDHRNDVKQWRIDDLMEVEKKIDEANKLLDTKA